MRVTQDYGDAGQAAADPSPAPAGRGEYHLTIMSDAGLASRLGGELKHVAHQYELTWPEFKRDPIGFVKRSIVGYGQMAARSFSNRNAVIAIGVAVGAMLALAVIIKVLDRAQSPGSSRFGLYAFSTIAFLFLAGCLLPGSVEIAARLLWGLRPSDSRNVAFGMVTAFCFPFRNPRRRHLG